MSVLVFDIETDGLLETVSKVHCLVIKDVDKDSFDVYSDSFKEYSCCKGTVEEGLKRLMRATNVIGHNIISYDIPVLEKLYNWFTLDKARAIDTLILGRLVYSNIKETDASLLRLGRLPGNRYGSHSLEAYGYRLGLQKGDYVDEFIKAQGDGYIKGSEWLKLSQEMIDYNKQDVVVTEALYNKLLIKGFSEQSAEIEHKMAWLMAQQVRNGFAFDVQKAAVLYSKLTQRRSELHKELCDFFGSWEERHPDFVPKRDNQKLGYKEGVPVRRVKTILFNPSSRDHIANRLMALYGWIPTAMTASGKPQVDESVLSQLHYPPCKVLLEYLLVVKRIAQLAEGDQAWLKLVRNGKIHGSINTNGAITGRATHAYPNIAQVPASSSPYGIECRELFIVPKGWTHLVGADASGLELRCLAHYMYRYDDGAYVEVVLNGDVHTSNQVAAGLPTRNNAKTFIYAFIYGAGDAKIGSIVGGDEKAGKKLRAKFLKSLPALDSLIKAVKEVSKRGYLLGLDGRKLYTRSAHSALNTLLQSAGALICKVWLILLEEALVARGLRHGIDGDFMFSAWVHDEVQIACRTPEVAKIVAELSPKYVELAGEYFKFKCPLTGESKVGNSWADTH
jgi:DNA polymerase-1